MTSSSGRDAIPLSFNQSTHLVLEWLARLRRRTLPPTRPLVLASYFDGPLNLAALERALNDVVRRHEVLRTAFPDVGRLTTSQEATVVERLRQGDLSAGWLFTQKLVPAASLSLRVESLPADGTGVETDRLRERLRGEILERFDYSKPPLMRATLFTLEAGRHLLLVSLHHLVADFWSLGILSSEIERLYNRQVAPQEVADLAGLSLQFGDFALAQRRQFSGDLPAEAAAYWTKQWSAYGKARLKPVDLSIGNPTASGPAEPRWDSVSFTPAQAERLRAAARTHRVTMYMLCAATIAIVFHAYTRATSVAWWGYCANRTTADIEGLIGWFAQGRVLGVTLASDDSVATVLAQVRRMVRDMAEYQDVPLQLLWRTLPSKDMVEEALQDEFIAFNIIPQWRSATALADGVVMSPVPGDLTVIESSRALKLWAHEAHGSLAAFGASYSTAWCEPSKVVGLLEDIRTVLLRIADDPHTSVAELASHTRVLQPPRAC